VGDLPSADWKGEFDLIVMTGHAFQAIIGDEELREFLAAVRIALRPGGRFVFETRNPLARAREHWAPEHVVSPHGQDGGEVHITTEIVGPFDRKLVTFTHTFTGAHASLPLVNSSSLRFLSQTAVAAMLADAGLKIVRQFGDFQGGELGSASPEIVTIAAV
jgi:SAM-dependent methyltransferase